MIELAPISFKPYLKEVIWGGTKICAFKGIPQAGGKIGESWEISAVPGNESVVAGGPYAGRTLAWLIEQFGSQLLGEKVEKRYKGQFPLLIKLIDANDNLSVQVHPDDELAAARHGCLGKTEMWYIISSEPGARIYTGLNTAMTPDEYVNLVAEGKFSDKVAAHDSHPGDVFFLPAGRVHAIGAGNFLAEIQESSDITYRIYDYDRLDADGKPRELHTEMAKDAIDFSTGHQYRNPPAPEHIDDHELASCDHFTTRRVHVDGKKELKFDPLSFTVIMCVAGNVTLCYPAGQMDLPAGHTVLVPAALQQIDVEGKGTLLVSYS